MLAQLLSVGTEQAVTQIHKMDDITSKGRPCEISGNVFPALKKLKAA